MSHEYVPIGTALNGLEVVAMPEGWTPIDGFVVVKSLDEDGGTRLSMRATAGIFRTEIIGMLLEALDDARGQARAKWNED